ncbi:MAG TPA: hypothetical protein VFH14_06390, partial [Gemmatimonadaceae bacterium]|nr:hypothetical protein [Gemmatimonadaceae bacterium]
MALSVMLIGVGFYIVVWLRHDQGRTAIGEWRTPPRAVRRIFRLGAGPLHLASLAIQVWAL